MDIVVPKEIYSILCKDLTSNNQKAFFDKFYYLFYGEYLIFSKIRYYNQGIIEKNLKILNREIRWNYVYFCFLKE